MAAMTDHGVRRRDPWLAPFVVAIVAFAASVGLLAMVTLAAVTKSDGGDGPTALDSGGPVSLLTYRGELPAKLAARGLLRADDGKVADITFTHVESGGIVVRYFVPVAAIGAGVDALSGDQLRAAAGGAVTSWREVGGVKGRPVFATAGPEADQRLEMQMAGGAAPARTLPTYDELRAAMTMDSGMVAMVPFDEVRPGMTAIAVDGADIVRGRGEPANWPFAERIAVTAGTRAGEEAAPGIVDAMAVELPAATTIVVTGDILQSRCTLARIEASGDWAAALRGPTGEYLAAADLTLGSLDGSIQDINRAYGCTATTNLSSPPPVMAALTLAGFDEVTVATNHVFDCGVGYCGNRAFLRTIELLDQAGIKRVGGGLNLEEALAPASFEVHGVRFGVLGFDDVAAMDLEATATEPGTAPLDDDYREERAAGEPAFFRPAAELRLTQFEDRIRRLTSQVDAVIVQVQSGTEDTHDPSERSVKALRAAADAGADLVVGNQAHRVQAIEVRDDAFIAYALGNLIFDQQHTPEHEQGYLLEATFRGKRLVNVRMLPYRIAGQLRPTLVSGEERAKILEDVFAASRKLAAGR